MCNGYTGVDFCSFTFSDDLLAVWKSTSSEWSVPPYIESSPGSLIATAIVGRRLASSLSPLATTGKLYELVDVLKRHKVDISCFQETKWNGTTCEGVPIEPKTDYRGDLNEHIGATSDGYMGVHGDFGYGVRNDEGRMILEFSTTHDLVVAKSFFEKRDAHLINFQSGGHYTQIDYMLVI
ncbi:craniofacial development protein 2 [Artemisia annua]|uniref:Craniofacial development protein 2 n=1 Tax=Artemisia annua TaxID=35608 RepID=A0A2U1N4N1_ARTAN|nr:craniofacial development protein 2 [Artemisia annua]